MDNNKMAITPKGLKYLLAGLLVMISGYILMTGGGSKDPAAAQAFKRFTTPWSVE